MCCLFVLIVFTSDHKTFCSLFKVRQHIIGCINHDIVIGLCAELFMRLSHYIYLGYDKKLSSHMGSNRGLSDCEPSTLPLDQSAIFIVAGVLLKKLFLILYKMTKPFSLKYIVKSIGRT